MSRMRSRGARGWDAMNGSISTRFKATRSARLARVSSRESVGLLARSVTLPTAVCSNGSYRSRS